MTCGYVCPQCEGTGVLENGAPCDYCNMDDVARPKEENGNKQEKQVDEEELIKEKR